MNTIEVQITKEAMPTGCVLNDNTVNQLVLVPLTQGHQLPVVYSTELVTFALPLPTSKHC